MPELGPTSDSLSKDQKTNDHEASNTKISQRHKNVTNSSRSHHECSRHVELARVRDVTLLRKEAQ